MSQTYRAYPSAPADSSLRVGAIGAVIGGAAAAARNLPAYRAGGAVRQEAVSETVTAALYAGAAAAATDWVARALGGRGPLTGLAALAAGGTVMYLLAKNASNEKDTAK